MQNPWSLDDDDIPTDPSARSRNRRLRIIGVGLWGLVIGSLAVVVVSDTGELTAVQAALLAGLAVVTAVVVLLLSWIAMKLFGMLGVGFGIGARLFFGLLFLLFLFTVLPPVLSALLENVSVFEGIPVDSDNPVGELLEWLRG